MMKNNRKILSYGIYILLGVILWILGMAEMVDEFWSGMGSALVLVGILRLVRIYRFKNDEAYREKMEIETTDERNKFIRNKAWAWAGYLFILIAACSVIILKVMGQEVLSMAASGALCLMMVLYYVSYFILRKKY